MNETRAFFVVLALTAPLSFGACRTSEPDDSQQRQARENQQAGSESVESVTMPPAQPEPAPQASPTPANEVAAPTGPANPALRNPALATEQAPPQYNVRLETTKGDVIIEVTRSWAPIGADRFYNLVRIGYFNDIAFFRVIPGFMAQLGLNGDPEVNAAWRGASIQDDPPTQSNTRGMVSFATSGPNSRVQQFFINFGDNSRLNSMGFAPFGIVRDMTTMDSIHGGYGEGAPGGRGPSQSLIGTQGNTYLRRDFPQLDYVRSATIVTP